jgi:GTP-binding protein
MKPVLALVGRPNVGKSTLFNRLTRSRDALVANFPGLTRDRHYGNAKYQGFEFIVIDTGGFEPQAKTGDIYQVMAKQTRQALVEADVVVFVLDAREALQNQALNAHDLEIAQELRQLGKPIVVVANKAEGLGQDQLAALFELGLASTPFAISAAHGQGISALLENCLAPWLNERLNPSPAAYEHEGLPPLTPLSLNPEAENTPNALESSQAAQEGGQKTPIRLAVVGRPNVGKSTLINTWLGEERLVAFDLPGTTRDTICIPFEYQGQAFELLDTAGLRRKGRVFEAIEKFSVVKTLQAIDSAHVVLLLLDATQGITDQDAHIASYILENGRAVVLAINKWDAADSYQRQLLAQSLDLRLAFLKFATVHHISAQKRQGLKPLWGSILQAYQAAHRKMPTPALTRLLQEAITQQSPPRAGMFRPKPRYAHQGGSNPPRIVIHGNRLEHLGQNYKRYLEGRFRKAFNLVGTPLFIEIKTAKNPYLTSG